jgi:alanine racemase
MSEFYDSQLNINLVALKRNYILLQNKVKPARCSVVIKANAYGLGSAKIFTTLIEAGCHDFFVATIAEALELRELNDAVNIYVFHGIKQNETDIFLKNSIIPVVNSLEQMDICSRFVKKKSRHLKIILNFDTGINRLGIEKNDYKYFYNFDYSYIDICYIMSHLACASEISARNIQQYHDFKKIIMNFPNSKYSFANSSAIFLGKKYHFDMVRAGVAIYGANPTPSKQNPMHNIITLTSRIIDIKLISEDGMVGYGSDTKIKKNSKIAIIALGYADGYFRYLSNKATCYIKGNYYPIIGKISMDLTIIDISSDRAGTVKINDIVELIGKNIKLDDVATDAGTISYEILTSLKGRYKINYLN